MFRFVLVTLVLALGLVGPCRAYASGTTLTTLRQTVYVAAQTKSEGVKVGAGVIIGARESLTIVTAAHVIQDATTIAVHTSTGEALEVKSTSFVAGHDLALMRTTVPAEAPHVAVSDDSVETDAPLFVWGHPHVEPFVLSTARLLTVRVTGGSSEDDFAITCPSCSVGDSGGGVFDQRGHLLGIVSALAQSAAPAAPAGVVIAEPIGPALIAAGLSLTH